MPPPSRNLMTQFLKEDFFDSLRWLFEGAVAWQATRTLVPFATGLILAISGLVLVWLGPER